MKPTISFFISLLLFTGAFSQTIIKGKVIDGETKQPLNEAVISIGKNKRNASTDNQGNFEIRVTPGTDSLYISYIGYKMQAIPVTKQPGSIQILLERGTVDLASVTITPLANNSSFHTISGIDLNLRPINSAQDLMRLVPGLFLGQHQGGGIAEHIFFRGFDADHGTDVNVSVDNMPLNLVSHAHGQGFSDLHFLIPEIVSSYEFGKGPYYADHGDFTTAGYAAFKTYEELQKSEVKIEGGMYKTGRVMAMINLLSARARLRGESAYIAGEIAYTDGAFDWKQRFSKGNLFGKYNVNLSAKTKLTATLSTFSSNWRSSGEIPGRAVEQGLIGRFGYLDSMQGGYTSRTNAIVKLRTAFSENLFMENQVYYSRYFFNEHYDPTLFADDSIHGDHLRQRETRDLFGYNGKITKRNYFTNGSDLSSSVGIGAQLNKIYNSELSHTVNDNEVLDYIQLGNITESSLNGYIDENYRLGKWLFNAGVRLDYLHFNYADKLNPPQPSSGKLVASPKLNIAYTASDQVQFYIKTGKGFHSNDAKVVAGNQGVAILPAAYGADVGINWKPIPRLYLNAAVWYLKLAQEFVYDADEGTFDAGDKSRREGIDLSARYQFTNWLFANFDINFSKARDIEAPKGSDYLPLSVPLSSTGGLNFKLPCGINGGLSYRYMKDRPANENNSLVAKGYFITDLTANYTQHKYEIGLEIQNLFNTKWNEAAFEVQSRMRNEPAPVDDISFTPGTPFFAKLKLAVFF
ncbi:MAG: TonB-dependent receptor [Bacteroidota bacterium]